VLEPLDALLALAVAWIADTAAYFAGRRWGRRKLAPSISPGKTTEGALGGLIFGASAMTAGGRWVFPETPSMTLLGVSAVVVAAGMIGDLFESLVKRSAGVKDSSNLIPGHGGVLDRIDSWLFAGPMFYLFTRYLQAP
jgi:phosphatidate cytidylyltransferase